MLYSLLIKIYALYFKTKKEQYKRKLTQINNNHFCFFKV